MEKNICSILNNLNNNSKNIINELESQNNIIQNINNLSFDVYNQLTLSEKILNYFKKINPINYLFINNNNSIEKNKSSNIINSDDVILNELNNLKKLNININNILTLQSNSLDNINENIENINSKIKYLNKRI